MKNPHFAGSPDSQVTWNDPVPGPLGLTQVRKSILFAKSSIHTITQVQCST